MSLVKFLFLTAAAVLVPVVIILAATDVGGWIGTVVAAVLVGLLVARLSKGDGDD